MLSVAIPLGKQIMQSPVFCFSLLMLRHTITQEEIDAYEADRREIQKAAVS